MSVHDADTATAPIFLLGQCGFSSVLHESIILGLLLIHCDDKFLMQASEDVLIALNLKLELLVGRAHVLHLLINDLLHFEQVSLILLIHAIKVVVKDLKRL